MSFTKAQQHFLSNHVTYKRFGGEVEVLRTSNAFGIELPDDHAMAYYPVPSAKANIDFKEGIRTPDENFFFEKDSVLLAMATTALGRPVMFTGPTGCGKSDFFFEFYARLGLPALRVQCNPELDYDDLIGSKGLKDSNTQFELGVLAFARKHDIAVCLDEVDSLRDGTQIALNGYLENRSPISLTGAEFNTSASNIIKATGFQSIWATSNTGGKQEARAGFGGTGEINKAVLDRMTHGLMDYLPPEVERNILKAKTGQSDPMVKGVIQTATIIRNAYKAGRIDTTMSTRSLIDWCDFTKLIGIEEAFNGATLNQAEESERRVFLDAYKTGMAQTHSAELKTSLAG